MENPTQPKKWYPPTNDYAFKCVFGNPQHLDITAGFIRDFFGIDVEPAEVRLLSSASIGQTDPANLDAEGRRRLYHTMRDITLEIIPAKITIEMQVYSERSFIKRSFYYASKLFADGYGSDPQAPSNYDSLKPVWSMNVLAHTRFEQDNLPYRVFTLRDEITAEPLNGWQPIRMGFFEIPKQLRAIPIADDSLQARRIAWAKFLATGIAPDDAPDYIKAAESIMVSINNNPEEAKMLDAMEKGLKDEQSRLGWARYDGIQEGAKTRETEIARNFLRAGAPIEMISEATGIPVAELLEMTALTPA